MEWLQKELNDELASLLELQNIRAQYVASIERQGQAWTSVVSLNQSVAETASIGGDPQASVLSLPLPQVADTSLREQDRGEEQGLFTTPQPGDRSSGVVAAIVGHLIIHNQVLERLG